MLTLALLHLMNWLYSMETTQSTTKGFCLKSEKRDDSMRKTQGVVKQKLNSISLWSNSHFLRDKKCYKSVMVDKIKTNVLNAIFLAVNRPWESASAKRFRAKQKWHTHTNTLTNTKTHTEHLISTTFQFSK